MSFILHSPLPELGDSNSDKGSSSDERPRDVDEGKNLSPVGSADVNTLPVKPRVRTVAAYWLLHKFCNCLVCEEQTLECMQSTK